MKKVGLKIMPLQIPIFIMQYTVYHCIMIQQRQNVDTSTLQCCNPVYLLFYIHTVCTCVLCHTNTLIINRLPLYEGSPRVLFTLTDPLNGTHHTYSIKDDNTYICLQLVASHSAPFQGVYYPSLLSHTHLCRRLYIYSPSTLS